MKTCPIHGCPACAVAAPRPGAGDHRSPTPGVGDRRAPTPGPGDRATKALNDFLGGFSAQARAEYGPTAAEWAEVNEEEVDE